jgi:Leucine-rich repeat (LRR) protein
MNFRFDRYMQHLDISNNVIVSLDKTSLRDLGVISLVQLNASRNYISDIDEEAFLGQSKLQTVDLSSNSLMHIETKTFIRNPSLEILSLSSNQYLRLPEEDPFLYSYSLRVLKLADCNLYYFPPQTFQKLPNLQELYISHNKFEVLSSLQSVGSLTLLDVGHNYLTDLQSDTFTALPELIRLNLSNNKLRTLNITVMPHLVKINSSIDLNGNPWVCDCLMCDTIFSWCRNNSVDLNLVCASPAKFKDKSLSNCEDGCVDFNSDFTDNVEELRMIEYQLPVKAHGNYEYQFASYLLETHVQDQESEHYVTPTYMYVSIVLAVVFLCLLTAVAFLLYRLKFRPSPHKCSAHSDTEYSPVESAV